jgi:hypothetical protein
MGKNQDPGSGINIPDPQHWPQDQPSALRKEHPALQEMKILSFFFLYLWVIFALLDPDTAAQINADPEQVQRSLI